MGRGAGLGGYGASKLVGEPIQLSERIVLELDLLSRNVDVLQRLSSERPVGIIRLSGLMQIPIHKVRYSMHLLERDGMIQPTPLGAITTQQAEHFWEDLDHGLDQMVEAIQFLKERLAEWRAVASGREGGWTSPGRRSP